MRAVWILLGVSGQIRTMENPCYSPARGTTKQHKTDGRSSQHVTYRKGSSSLFLGGTWHLVKPLLISSSETPSRRHYANSYFQAGWEIIRRCVRAIKSSSGPPPVIGSLPSLPLHGRFARQCSKRSAFLWLHRLTGRGGNFGLIKSIIPEPIPLTKPIIGVLLGFN